MKLQNTIALVISGALILGSLLLSEMGFRKSTLSRYGAMLVTGLGVGLSSGMIVFWGIGDGDLIGSIATGMIAAIAAGVTEYFALSRRPG